MVKESLSAQLKVANKLAVRFTLILGQKEVLDGTIIIRDMDSGSQEIVDIKKLEKELAKRIEKAPKPSQPRTVGAYDALAANLEEQPVVPGATVAETPAEPPVQPELPV